MQIWEVIVFMFGNKYVAKTVKQVRQFTKGSSEIASGLVEKETIKKLKKTSSQTKFSIVKDGLSYEALAFLVMSNVLFEQLSSGRYHIYRGRLSIIGNSLLAIWGQVCEGLETTGSSTKDETAEDTRQLMIHIGDVG